MPLFAVIDAPSVLGLRPTGVGRLSEVLKAAGLLVGLNAEDVGRVEPLPYNPRRDPQTLILNPDALRAYSLRLAAAVVGFTHPPIGPTSSYGVPPTKAGHHPARRGSMASAARGPSWRPASQSALTTTMNPANAVVPAIAPLWVLNWRWV